MINLSGELKRTFTSFYKTLENISIAMLALIDGSVIFICNDVIPLFTETNIFLRLLHVKYYSVFRGRTRADCRCEQIARFGDDQKEKKSLEI